MSLTEDTRRKTHFEDSAGSPTFLAVSGGGTAPETGARSSTTVSGGDEKEHSLNPAPAEEVSSSAIMRARLQPRTGSLIDLPEEVAASQADAYRHAQTIRYPGYDPTRVHALPYQNGQKLDHLKYVRQVLYQNRENLNRFGIRKEMKKLLERRSIQKFMLDGFWWIFLDCFAGVNFDLMVSRVKKNQLVSDIDIRAYLRPVSKESMGYGAKARKADAVSESLFTPAEGGTEDQEKKQKANSQLIAEALGTFGIGTARRPVVAEGDSDVENEDDEDTAEKKRKRKEADDKKKKKLRTTREDFAPPVHLNPLKPKNRRAEDVALIGSPRCPSVDSLTELVRSSSTDPSEWSDSDADSTTSFASVPLGDATDAGAQRMQQQGREFEPSSAATATTSGGDEYLANPVIAQAKVFGNPILHAPAGAATGAVGAGSSHVPPKLDFSSVTCPRERLVAQRMLQVKKFRPTTVAYALHRMEPPARRCIIASEQHLLFSRMAANYGSTIQKISRRLHHTHKDGITRLFPDLMAQILFLFYHAAVPYATHLLDAEFQEYLWDTFSYWTGGVHRHGNVKGWPIHVLVDPLLLHKAEVKAMEKALAEEREKERGAGGVGGRRGSHFSLGSSSITSLPRGVSALRIGGALTGKAKAPVKPPQGVSRVHAVHPAASPLGAPDQERKQAAKAESIGKRGIVNSTSKPRLDGVLAPNPPPSKKQLGSSADPAILSPVHHSTSSRAHQQQHVRREVDGATATVSDGAVSSGDVLVGGGEGSARMNENSSMIFVESPEPTFTPSHHAHDGTVKGGFPSHPSAPSATTGGVGTANSGSSSKGIGGGGFSRAPAPPSLPSISSAPSHGATQHGPSSQLLTIGAGGSGHRSLARRKSSAQIDVVSEFLAPNSKANAVVQKEVELMRTELHRLRTTHTFSQSHYTTHSTAESGGAANPLRHKMGHQGNSPPTVPEGGGAGPGGAEGGGGGNPDDPLSAMVHRTKYIYAIGPKKRTVQVIKSELDLRYRDAVPWYGSSKARVPIKEQLGASKFSLTNWSPLVHRYLLGCGEDNRLPAAGMTWTIPSSAVTGPQTARK